MATKKTSAKKSTKATSAKKDVKATENVITARLAAAQKIAQTVWFAGLGAVGRSVDEAKDNYAKVGDQLQARYSQLNKGSQELVEDLVTRGEKVQDEAETRLKEGRATVEEQIEAAKDRMLGLTSVVDIPARLQDLSDKLESLSKDLKKSA